MTSRFYVHTVLLKPPPNPPPGVPRADAGGRALEDRQTPPRRLHCCKGFNHFGSNLLQERSTCTIMIIPFSKIRGQQRHEFVDIVARADAGNRALEDCQTPSRRLHCCQGLPLLNLLLHLTGMNE